MTKLVKKVSETSVTVTTRKHAEEMHLRLLNNVQDIKKRYFEVAEDLYKMKKTKGYALLGYSSFGEYVECSEINLSARSCLKLVDIHKFFVLPIKSLPKKGVNANIFHAMQGVGWSKLSELLPTARLSNQEQLIKLLEMAENMTQKELRKLVRNSKNVKEINSNYEQESAISIEPGKIFEELTDKFITSIHICNTILGNLITAWQFHTKEGIHRLITFEDEEKGSKALEDKLFILNRLLKKK